MNNEVKRDLGVQALAGIMAEFGFKPNDLVSVSTEQLTHKMVSRAAKGRRLTPGIQKKVLNALNKAAGKCYQMGEVFNY